MLTTGTYMNVNFKKMLEMLIFLFILSTHPINSLSKVGQL